MKRLPAFLSIATAALAVAIAGAMIPAPAETIVYEFAALPGPVSTCQWFDDNLNDRSIDALIRQTDLLYNRVALPPDQPVTVTQNGTTALGAPLVAFDLGKRLVCAGAQAVDKTAPEPTPTPPEN